MTSELIHIQTDVFERLNAERKKNESWSKFLARLLAERGSVDQRIANTFNDLYNLCNEKHRSSDKAHIAILARNAFSKAHKGDAEFDAFYTVLTNYLYNTHKEDITKGHPPQNNKDGE